MARLNPVYAAALIGAMPLIASCAPAGSADAGAAALTPKQSRTLDKYLAGKVAGEPVRCLPHYASADTIRVSDDILLYRQGSRIVYRNDLKGRCPGLARDSDIMVADRRASSAISSPIANRRGTKAEPTGPAAGGVRFAPSSRVAAPPALMNSHPFR
jgi:hypothetical protein